MNTQICLFLFGSSIRRMFCQLAKVHCRRISQFVINFSARQVSARLDCNIDGMQVYSIIYSHTHSAAHRLTAAAAVTRPHTLT